MNIFNSLGSNYNFAFVLKALFAKNKESYSENLKEFLKKKYEGRAILLYKGREAIGLALEILKLPKSTVVAINGFTCFAVYKAIEDAGYEAVCLDLEDKFPTENDFDLNFSAQELLTTIKQNPKIKIVIIQNTLGYPCDIEEIAKICKENNLILIEDLAHSVGTIYKNAKEAGTVGDFVILSFSQDKIIDAVSGGALIIRNKKYQDYSLASQGETLQGKQQLIDRLYPLFTFLIRKTYQIRLGKLIHFILNYLNLLSKPMNESFYAKYNLPNWYQYLVLNAFDDLNEDLKHRQKIASVYAASLDKKIVSEFINKNINLSANLRYPIFLENRKPLISYLKKEGVRVSDIWYDSVDNDLENTKTVSNRILNLPTHINVSEKDAKLLSKKINLWMMTMKQVQHDNFRIITKNIDNKEEWEKFLSYHKEANFLQSWYWGEFHKNLGNDIQRTGFYQGKKLIGVMLSIVEDAKRGRYLTVPGGPIIDWTNSELVNCFASEIKKIAEDTSCVFVRVRPQLESSEFSKSLFKRYRFVNAPMHLHAESTSQLDITKREQELLSQMRKTTRYEIKRAINQGIKITSSNDPMIIKKFYELQIETAKRQNFVPFSYDFLHEQFKVFAENDRALLYGAWIEKTLLAQAFIIFYGQEAVYHYGSSTEDGRKYPGAYLIQWKAILEAKRRGMSRYNFWGVAPATSSEHRFSGLSLFKRGFGGEDVEYLHAQDLIINYPKYIISYAIERIRKRVRNV